MILDVLARQVATRGTHPFLRHDGRSVPYAEFDRLSNRAAHALRGLGVERGDRVTLACGNSIDYVVAAFGALKAGAILNPVNPGLGAAELGMGRRTASSHVSVILEKLGVPSRTAAAAIAIRGHLV